MRREVFNTLHVIGGKHPTVKRFEVQPTIGSISETSIIEIESVDVDVGAHGGRPKKQRPSGDGLAPCAEALGGINLAPLNIHALPLHVEESDTSIKEIRFSKLYKSLNATHAMNLLPRWDVPPALPAFARV